MTYDFYDLLDISEDASQEEVRRAFRERVREVHPDLNDDPRAPAQFTALKKGYDVLKDPVERRAYDRMGHLDYVAKRMEGLPDPEKWAPEETDSTGSSGSVSSVTGTVGSGTSTSTGSSKSTGSTSTGSTSTGSASSGSSRSATTSTADASGSAGRGTSVGSSTSRGPRSSAAGSTASTDGAGTGTGATVAGSSTGTTSVETSILDRLRGNVGWPLVFATAAVYLAGLGAYLQANRAGVEAFVSRVGDATTADAAWMALTATDYAVAPLYAFVRAGLFGDGSAPRAALFAAGAVVLPTVYLVVVRMTRTARSFAWKPTYLYVVAALAPLVAIAAGAAGLPDAARPAVSLGTAVVLPVLAIVVLPLNAFVVPRIRRRLR